MSLRGFSCDFRVVGRPGAQRVRVSKKHRGTRVRLFLKVAAAGVAFSLLMTAMLALQVQSGSGQISMHQISATPPMTVPEANDKTTIRKRRPGPAKKVPNRRRRHFTESLATYDRGQEAKQRARWRRRQDEQQRIRRTRRRQRAASIAAARTQAARVAGPPAPVAVPTPVPVTTVPS